MTTSQPSVFLRLLDVQRIAAAFCALFGLAGVGLSVHLTRLKFQMLYTPCKSAYGGCRIGGLACEDALGSSWSMVLGVPISVWGAGFYLTIAVAAVMVLRQNSFGGTAANLLIALTTFAVLVSATLAGYTAVVLPSPCPFCMALYAVAVLVFVSALLAWRPPGGVRLTFRQLVQERLADALDGVFALSLVMVASTGIQALGYHGFRNLVDAQDGCPELAEDLPEATIRVGAESPQAVLALFVDMTCPKCLSEFKRLGRALQDEQFPAPVQLRVYHMPRQACDTSAFPDTWDRKDNEAGNNNACLAALAAECAEKLEGRGFLLMDGMFALHGERQASAALFTPERIANRAVELGINIDPDDRQNPLFRCIDGDKEVLDRITAHQKYSDRPGFMPPTVLIYRAEAGALDLRRKPLVANANTSLNTILDYVRTQAEAELQP